MAAQAPDPRVGLAQQRTGLAKFRTRARARPHGARVDRTALTMATFGFGTVGFFRSLRAASPTPESIQLHQSAIRFGLALVVLGIGATVLAGLTQWLALRRLERDEVPVSSRWPLSLTVSLLLAILGAAALWSLLAR